MVLEKHGVLALAHFEETNTKRMPGGGQDGRCSGMGKSGVGGKN